jgi:legumain
MKSFIAAAALAALSAASSNHWAVIMAGSNTYGNYRHQADTHHAVQIMLDNGIPRENIIHMAYDDIANSSSNPFPGQLFNKPLSSTAQADIDAANVYNADYIDYTGKNVTAQNFYNVLLGDDSNGPALKTDSESYVFVNFADHGGTGLLGVPYGCGSYIYADELNSVLQQMSDNNKFKQLTFYVEACESGSMFPNLTDQENIYAFTASNATQSSWAAYCGSQAEVAGQNIGSCLGDLFSINWMEDSESHNVSVETLSQQYQTVKEKTTASPVQQFGDLTWLSEPVGDFQGTCSESTLTETLLEKATYYYEKAMGGDSQTPEIVDSRDHDLHMAYHRVTREGTSEAYHQLQMELEHRQFTDKLFSMHFGEMANAPTVPQDWECYRSFVETFEESCGRFSSYSLKYVGKLAKMCDTQPELIQHTMKKVVDMCQAI